MPLRRVVRLLVGTIHEPVVMLTDYLLAFEACWCAWSLRHRARHSTPIMRAGMAFFLLTAVAASCGGTVHGFFANQRHNSWHRRLWTVTLLALGGSSGAAWSIAAQLLFAPLQARRVTLLGLSGVLVYAGVVLRGAQQFIVAVVGYLPATIFLLFACAQRYFRRREAAAGTALAGVTLTLLATGIQQKKVTIHPRYCDHNVLYHLIMGVALPLFAAGLRRLTSH